MTTEPQSQSSSKALRKAGKDCLSLKEQKAENGLSLIENKHLHGLLDNSRQAMQGMTVTQAYKRGFSLSKALKAEPAKVRLTMLAELERLVRHVNATRTFQTQTDLQDAVEDICELFPSMKLEEVLIAFKQIRQGRFDLYGNFTTNVLIDCIRNYEMQNTVTMREQEHVENKKQQVETAAIDWQRLKRDLDAEGLLKTPRKVLDRTFIPYPNDKEDAATTEQHWQQGEKKGEAQAQREGNIDEQAG